MFRWASWWFLMQQPQIFKPTCFHLWLSTVKQHRAAHGGTQNCSGEDPLGNEPLNPLSPSSYSQTHMLCIQIPFQSELLYLYSGFFLMTAVLFNIAPEELGIVLQSSKYKSSLNLSPKYSCCCQERILEECSPAFPSLIWRLWFMFYSILLPLPSAAFRGFALQHLTQQQD